MALVPSYIQQLANYKPGKPIAEAQRELGIKDFIKLADAYGATGIRVKSPKDLDDTIIQMIETPGPVIVDCQVASSTNCFPMIPSGRAHNDMLLGEDVPDEVVANAISDDGKVMV